MTTTDIAAPTGVVDHDSLTRAQKALLALTGDVARQLAKDHGVCTRPLAMRRIDLTTGRVDVVPIPCGARREDVCRPCADKQRRLRMVQCREDWHLDTEPVPARPAPTDGQKQLLAIRADLLAAYLDAKTDGDTEECGEIASRGSSAAPRKPPATSATSPSTSRRTSPTPPATSPPTGLRRRGGCGSTTSASSPNLR